MGKDELRYDKHNNVKDIMERRKLMASKAKNKDTTEDDHYK